MTVTCNAKDNEKKWDLIDDMCTTHEDNKKIYRRTNTCAQWMGTAEGWKTLPTGKMTSSQKKSCDAAPQVHKLFTGDLQKTLAQDNIPNNLETEFTCDCPASFVKVLGAWNSYDLPDGTYVPIDDSRR